MMAKALWLLGGNLGEHSHSNIGNYNISVNSIQLSGDPGGPIYCDANTFKHPVPIVNGKITEISSEFMKDKGEA